MKKLLLSASAIALSLAAVAQCNQLFISEYVVSSGNNKAYELYNPTAEDIDLGPYQLQRFSNGSQSASDWTELAGTIPAYGTWVVVNGQDEDIDLGTYISPASDPALRALADQLDNPYPAPTFMNGNDALVLVKNPGTAAVEICDIFGKYGEDPGQAWTAPDGTFITKGYSLIRKPNVEGGVTVNPVEFDPLAEWDTLPSTDWSTLGSHTCDCFVSGLSDRSPLNVSVYPTLVKDSSPINVSTNHGIKKVEVYDITGKVVKTSLSLSNSTSGTLNVGNLASGAYILNIYMEDNVNFSTRFIKE